MKNKYFNQIFLWLGILGFGIAQIQNPVSLKLNEVLSVRSGEVANVTFTAFANASTPALSWSLASASNVIVLAII